MPVPIQWAALLDRLSGVTHTLLTMTLAATVAALVVMALRLALGKAPRRYIFILWMAVLIRMIWPFGVGLGFVSLIPEPVTSGRAAETILERGGSRGEQTPPEAVLPVPAQKEQFEGADRQPEREQTETVPAPAQGGEGTVRVAPAQLLTAVWLAGTAGMLLWAAVSYAKLRRRVSEAVMVEPDVYESDAIDTPFVLNSDIYLPVGLAEEDRRYVLLHEQAHIDNTDSLFKGLAWLALSLHWFNPVLWLAYRLMCRDVETACDQRVIEGFDPKTRREDVAGYAAALFHLGRRQRLPQAVLPFGEENAKGRIRNVLHYRRPAWWTRYLLTALCAVMFTGLVLNAPAKAEPVETPSGAVIAAENQIVLPPEEAAETLTEEKETAAAASPSEVPFPASPVISQVPPAAASAAGSGRGIGGTAGSQDSAAALYAQGTTVRRAGPGRDPAAEVQALFLAAGAERYLNEETALVYVQNNEIKVLLTEDVLMDDETLTRAANRTVDLTDGADTLRVYDREGAILMETFGRYEAMGEEEFRALLQEEAAQPAVVPRAPEPVEIPAPREPEPLPDSLDFDFTQQEGAE